MISGWHIAAHVWPVDDAVEHQLEGCPCMPRIEETSTGEPLNVHHSLDGRELSEHDDEVVEQHVADPATAHIACPCGVVVAVKIPVLTSLDLQNQRLVASVDHADGYGQELWDHQLQAHGPQLG